MVNLPNKKVVNEAARQKRVWPFTEIREGLNLSEAKDSKFVKGTVQQCRPIQDLHIRPAAGVSSYKTSRNNGEM